MPPQKAFYDINVECTGQAANSNNDNNTASNVDDNYPCCNQTFTMHRNAATTPLQARRHLQHAVHLAAHGMRCQQTAQGKGMQGGGTLKCNRACQEDRMMS
jgi:hypothetical protein